MATLVFNYDVWEETDNGNSITQNTGMSLDVSEEFADFLLNGEDDPVSVFAIEKAIDALENLQGRQYIPGSVRDFTVVDTR